MHDLSPEELLSAYLDNEVTDAQRAEVEELLQQPDYRQLLEELRTLRAALEALPAQRLEPEFAQRVLRRAERDVLAGQADASPAVASRGSSLPTTAAAIASQASQAPPPYARPARWRRPLVYVAVALAAALALVVYNPQWWGEADVARVAENDHVPTTGASTSSTPTADAEMLARGEPSASGLSRRSADELTAEERAAGEVLGKGGMASKAADLADLDASSAFGTTPSQAGAGGANVALSITDAAMGGYVNQRLSEYGQERLARNWAIIQCDIAPAEAGDAAINEVFVNNKIAVSAAPVEVQPQATQLAAVTPPRAEDAAVTQNVEDVKLVYVVATNRQIEATLAELNNRTDVFFNVAVQPAVEEPLQQQWMSYNRNGTALRPGVENQPMPSDHLQAADQAQAGASVAFREERVRNAEKSSAAAVQSQSATVPPVTAGRSAMPAPAATPSQAPAAPESNYAISGNSAQLPEGEAIQTLPQGRAQRVNIAAEEFNWALNLSQEQAEPPPAEVATTPKPQPDSYGLEAQAEQLAKDRVNSRRKLKEESLRELDVAGGLPAEGTTRSYDAASRDAASDELQPTQSDVAQQMVQQRGVRQHVEVVDDLRRQVTQDLGLGADAEQIQEALFVFRCVAPPANEAAPEVLKARVEPSEATTTTPEE